MKPIKSIVFVINVTKTNAQQTAEALASIARSKGIEVRFITEFPLDIDQFKSVDLCCSIGGDGTLLGVVEPALENQTAVLGINLGKLGFLATFSIEQIKHDFSKILEGQYSIEERSVLYCKSSNKSCAYALNDLVIKENKNAGLIRLKVKSDDELISEYHCDGLIFASPTGSTAYNLSAGGPIISPNVEAIAMTPICPHTLGNRSVIFDSHKPIEVFFEKAPSQAIISIDGQIKFQLEGSPSIQIQLADKRFKLIQNSNNSHFSVVRNKLNWGDPTIR